MGHCGFGVVWFESLPDLEGLIRAGVLGVKSLLSIQVLTNFQWLRPSIWGDEDLAKYDLPYLIHAELENGDVDRSSRNRLHILKVIKPF